MVSCLRGKCRAASGSKLGMLAACVAAMLSVPLVTAPGTATAEPYYTLTQALSPGGKAITAFDIIETNPVLGLVAFSDKGTTGIDVFSTLNNTYVTTFDGFVAVRPTCTIPGTTTACDSGPNGTIFVGNTQLWGGDGNSTVRVFDIASQSLVTVINIPNGTPFTRTDEGCYDPVNKVVEIHNDRDGFISFIAAPGYTGAAPYTVLSQISMNGTVNNGSGLVAPKATNGIEQCRWNPRNGLIYLNVPQNNGTGVSGSAPGAVVVINGATRQIVNVFTPPLSACVNPTGMAIGPATAAGNQILLACAGPQAVCQPVCATSGPVIIDDTSGNVIMNFPNDFGADEIYYDPGNGHYFLAESGAAPSQIGNIDAFNFSSQPISLGATIGTASGTHTVAADPILNQVYVPIANTAAAQSLHLCSSVGGNDALGCLLVFTTDSAPTAVVDAVLPNARTTTPGGTVTAFATIANIGAAQATGCSIALPNGTPANLTYQTTNPANNQPTGTANTAVNINAGQSQSFYFAVMPTTTLSQNLRLRFACTDTAAAPVYAGLNTFQVTAATTPIPDMLSISATPTNDGNVVTSGLSPGVMMTATMNIAAAGTVTFTPTDTPPGEVPRNLPVTLTICQVNASAMCLATATPSVTLAVTAGQTLMFAVFVTPTGGDPSKVPYIPAYNRIFFLATAGATPVGLTSTALKMQ
jgi:hypothetical protein